jgi:hypothetical protein
MRARLAEEVAHAREYYPALEHVEHGGADWFRLPVYPFPTGWRIGEKDIDSAPIAFKLVPTYPQGEPYGFVAPAGINFKGQVPGSPGSAVSPPFEGGWQHFSWAPDGWFPGADPRAGSNLLAWIRSFKQRLGEGA